MATDLFQHRLWFSKPYEWEDIAVIDTSLLFSHEVWVLTILAAVKQIPFSAFVLTNYGRLISRESSLMTDRVRTLGISILGGNSGVEGRYELGLDTFKAVNEASLP